MSIKYLEISDQSNLQKGDVVYYGTQRKDTGNIGDIYMLPDNAGRIERITVTLSCLVGRGYVEFSNSTRDEVKTNAAEWDKVSFEVVGNDIQSVTIAPITALRLHRLSGIVKMEITAQ